MLFDNLSHLIMNININQYHTLLLEENDHEALQKDFGGVTYRLTNNKFGYGGVDVTGGVNMMYNMLAFDNWLIETFDKEHTLLKRCMVSQYGFDLEVNGNDIVEYVNNITDLHKWLLSNNVTDLCKWLVSDSDKDRKGNYFNFDRCPIKLVNDTFNAIYGTDGVKLLDLLRKSDGEIVLYRSHENNTIDCVLKDDNTVDFVDRVTGLTIELPLSKFRGTSEASNFSSKKLYMQVGGEAISLDTFYNVRSLVNVMSAIYKLKGERKLI